MKFTFEIVFLFLSLNCLSFAQDDLLWKEKSSFSIDSSDIWTVDVLGNTYITKKELIQKYDSTGILKFSQSQKSIGRLTSLQSINTMKIVVFSEEQQLFCFLDNTLTPYESCVDLIDHSIGNATKIAISSQPNKFWVYDQLNSRLHLLSLIQTEQAQDVENLKGMLNSIQISSMLEQNGLLYLVDTVQGVFVLDMYGSLVNSIKKTNIKGIQVDFENIYLLEEDFITIINLETNIEVKIQCPLKNIIEFRKNSQHYFFRSNTEIKKYQLLLAK